MASKISQELSDKLEELESGISLPKENKTSIIVTFESPGFYSSVLPKLIDDGLDVKNRFPEINAVSGTIQYDRVRRLAEHFGVKVIENDSDAYALT